MKYKVVVIDDKPLIRQAIVQTIPWEKLNCVVVGQAEDGIEGKRLILELAPDILVTDIKMPGLSGLDLAEVMSITFPMSRTILVTGYQDFEFAKRAVRLGVFDFIVKPINNQELSKVIAGAVSELESRRAETENAARISTAFVELEKQHNSSIPSLRSKLIGDLIAGKDNVQDLVKQLEIQFSRYVLLIVRTKGDARGGTRTAKLRQQSQVQLIEQAHELTAKRDFELIELVRNDDLVFVSLFPKLLPQREIKMKLQSFCSEFVDAA
ncbi:MAG: two component transcriptional regulator, AraC family, partial [Paenibacillus sp.]|nr:two component transcriptional regulator, AraC family [Paenibacillus sp.]